jgi:hypothetical protein
MLRKLKIIRLIYLTINIPEDSFLEKIEHLKGIRNALFRKKIPLIKKYSINIKERKITISPNFLFYPGKDKSRLNFFKAVIKYTVIKERLLKITISIFPNLIGWIFFGMCFSIVCMAIYRGSFIAGTVCLTLFYLIWRAAGDSIESDINEDLFKEKMHLYRNVSTKF